MKQRDRYLLNAEQAGYVLELWQSRRFDTFDIHRILRVPEHAVARTIQTARDVIYLGRVGA